MSARVYPKIPHEVSESDWFRSLPRLAILGPKNQGIYPRWSEAERSEDKFKEVLKVRDTNCLSQKLESDPRLFLFLFPINNSFDTLFWFYLLIGYQSIPLSPLSLSQYRYIHNIDFSYLNFSSFPVGPLATRHFPLKHYS